MDTKSDLCIGSRANNLANPVIIPNIGGIFENEIIWLDENILDSPYNFISWVSFQRGLFWVNASFIVTLLFLVTFGILQKKQLSIMVIKII